MSAERVKASERCSACRFALPLEKNYRGETPHACRRYPPIVVPKRSSCASWMGLGWPTVSGSDWCGEFQPTLAGRAALTSNSKREGGDVG